MQQLQFIQTTPEQLQEAILQGVKTQLEQLSKNFQPKAPEQYMTREEVADMLKIHKSTVHEWGKSGRLKRYGIGHRILFKRSEVEQAIIEL